MKSETNSFYRYFPVSRRDKNWGLYITTAGEARITPHSSYPPSGHPKGYAFNWQQGRMLDGFALVYISSGSGKFESKPHEPLSVEVGHAFLLFPKVWHRYAPNTESGWHEHWIGFDGEIARRWLRHKLFSAKNPVAKINGEDTVLATFSRMMQSIRANRPALQQILAGATDNLMGLIYSAQQAQPVTDAQNANAIESAIARIQADFARDLNMKLLARELEFRLVRARSLLAETEFSIKEIATQTGFEDEFYFSRLFRQKLNLTPSQWRTRSRQYK